MFDSIDNLLAEHAELTEKMGDPAVHADQALARKVGRRFAELERIVKAHKHWQQLAQDLEDTRELAQEDEDFAAEIPQLEADYEAANEMLHRLLIPRDPDDARNVILEVKGGEGGEEAALFAADLARMYIRYAENKGWKTELISATESDLGGYKDVHIGVTGNSNDPAEGVFAHLKYEGGVHRVQRVPVTESQGRIHTSAAGVLVFPEVDEPEEIAISQSDLKIDVYRSSGPGGQHVNTTDSAVRITHLPTGIVVAMQMRNRRSRTVNPPCACYGPASWPGSRNSSTLKQLRHVPPRSGYHDRSERIRTYNFPENRIADHRTGYKANNLDRVLEGDMNAVIASLIEMDEAERLAALGETSKS